MRRAIAAAAPFGTDLQVVGGDRDGQRARRAGRPERPATPRDGDRAVPRARFARAAGRRAADRGDGVLAGRRLDEARAYVAEARPLHADTRRIARVVLLSAAAGVALADGDIAAAVDFGAAADLEATELGVEREVPLIRCASCAGAAGPRRPRRCRPRAAAVLGAARDMPLSCPLALGLETAAWSCTPPASPATAHSASSSPPPRSSAGR